MSELRGLLFSHEARQQANLTSLSNSMANLTVQTSDAPLSGSDSSSPSAYYAGNRPNYNSNSGNSNYPRRGRGNSRGNYRGRGRGRSSSSLTDSIQCQICLKWGHSAVKCYHRFNITYTADNAQPSSSSTASSSSALQALLAEPHSSPSPEWFLDSGASTHITNDINNLSSHVVYAGTDKVHIGNGAGLHISHVGSSLLHTSGSPLHLSNVLCVPSITKNLISISQLLKDNHVLIEFIDSTCFVKDKVSHQICFMGQPMMVFTPFTFLSLSPMLFILLLHLLLMCGTAGFFIALLLFFLPSPNN